jgi:hypothetical protein
MPNNIQIGKLSASYDVGKSHFHVGKKRMQLGLGDTLKFKRNNTILSKENCSNTPFFHLFRMNEDDNR